jgi:hypothetical protein
MENTNNDPVTTVWMAWCTANGGISQSGFDVQKITRQETNLHTLSSVYQFCKKDQIARGGSNKRNKDI